MNIAYSSSDSYAEICGISITSLLENNKNVEKIHFLIIDNNISEQNKVKLQKTIESYGRTVEFYLFENINLNESVNIQKWNKSTFARLFEGSLFPNHIKKVIHIDCDTIITGSIEHIWNIDIDDYAFAGVPDLLSNEYKKTVNISFEDDYINAGVLVLNLDYFRRNNCEESFAKYIDKNYKFLTYVDQEVINACIPSKKIKTIEQKYNSFSIIHYFSYEKIKKIRKLDKYISKDEYMDAVNKPVIIHFTSCFMEGSRPWFIKDNHPKRQFFLEYKDHSLWKNTPLWINDKGLIRNVKFYLLKIIARLFPRIIGFIHGVYVPKKNIKKRGK